MAQPPLPDSAPVTNLKSSTLQRCSALAALALLFALPAWSYGTGGIVAGVLSAESTAEQKLAELRMYFADFGSAAPFADLTFVTVEVIVAPIPGTMLYAPGGIIFGGFEGGLLSLLGNVLGAGIACQMARVLGGQFTQRYLSSSSVAPLQQRIVQRGAWVIFLLRVNPLTSSDVVSYAAGLSGFAVWRVMLGTAFGMAPLCFAQSYLADGLIGAFPKLIYPLAIACAVYTLIVVWVTCRLVWRPS